MCAVFVSQQRISGIVLSLILTAGCSYQDCVLPVHPAHGRHVPFEFDCPAGKTQSPACQGEPGTPVPDGWFLFVRCDQGFVLDNGEQGNSQTTCADGRWLPSLPSCVYNFTEDRHRCAAPPYPQNGRYKPLPIECGISTTAAEDYLQPGTFVPSSCVLLYSCDKGYGLSDDDVISICVKGEWIPKNVNCTQGSNLVATRTNNVREPPRSGCVLPKQPQNRRYCSFQCKECTNRYNMCVFSPGTVVTDNVVKVECDYGYGLADHQNSAIVCINGTWNTQFPQCLKLCPSLESDSVYPQCQHGTMRVDCNKPMLPGTTAIYHCRPSYSEYPSLTMAGVYKRKLTCRQDGKWSNTLPECQPVCGVSKGGIKISPTIVDGIDTPLGAFPWHAGLYTQDGKSWKCICGGSLISKRIVLTAAHCVVLQDPTGLKVALGKYYRAWDYEEPLAVKCNVSDIRIPGEYNGAATTYGWDIALVLLTEKVQINSFVMPVCRDIQMTLEITEETTGYVVGWGKTIADGKESDILLHSDLTIIDHTVCSRKIPKILAFDKFCGAKGSVSVAEKGDSGGGLTTISNDLHYIIGIVSIKIDNLSFFTNVSWPTHQSWLENEIDSLEKEI